MLRSAGTVGLLTMCSRLFGYLRDVILAALLGTTAVGDAWGAAFELPNTLRRLASEGNLSAAFVPVFSHAARRRSEEQTWMLADRFHTAVFLVVTVLTLVGILFAPTLVPLLYPGFAASPGKIELTVRLARWVFAYALFISLSAVLMAVLNARDRFAAAAFTPVLLNAVVIAFGAVAWATGAVQPVAYIAAGVVLGGLAQWLFLVPFARRLGMRFRFLPQLADPDLREVGRLILPRLFGVGVVQINILVGKMLASGLGEGAVASLYYSTRITELTLGVFAVSVATVVLPPMSRQGAAGDFAGMRTTLGFALRQVTVVTLPATVGLFMLRHEIVAVLFERGRFDAASTALSAAALGGYAVGLVAVAVVRITAPGFYALRDTRTPVAVATVAMVVNVVGCLALRGPLGNAGIALANSVASIVSAALLLFLLRGRLGRLGGRRLLSSLTRIVVAAAAMASAVWWASDLAMTGTGSGAQRAMVLLAVILLGALVYGACLLVLRAPEVDELRAIFRGAEPATLSGGSEPPEGRESGRREGSAP